jgi:hypothetical protein
MSEYQRGVSAWNFDIEDLKAQASLICDDDPLEVKEHDDSARITGIDKDTSSDSHFGKPTQLNGNHSRFCKIYNILASFGFQYNFFPQLISRFSFSMLMIINQSLLVGISEPPCILQLLYTFHVSVWVVHS